MWLDARDSGLRTAGPCNSMPNEKRSRRLLGHGARQACHQSNTSPGGHRVATTENLVVHLSDRNPHASHSGLLFVHVAGREGQFFLDLPSERIIGDALQGVLELLFSPADHELHPYHKTLAKAAE